MKISDAKYSWTQIKVTEHRGKFGWRRREHFPAAAAAGFFGVTQ